MKKKKSIVILGVCVILAAVSILAGCKTKNSSRQNTGSTEDGRMEENAVSEDMEHMETDNIDLKEDNSSAFIENEALQKQDADTAIEEGSGGSEPIDDTSFVEDYSTYIE